VAAGINGRIAQAGVMGGVVVDVVEEVLVGATAGGGVGGVDAPAIPAAPHPTVAPAIPTATGTALSRRRPKRPFWRPGRLVRVFDIVPSRALAMTEDLLTAPVSARLGGPDTAGISRSTSTGRHNPNAIEKARKDDGPHSLSARNPAATAAYTPFVQFLNRARATTPARIRRNAP
jgi:hypothetical protein